MKTSKTIFKELRKNLACVHLKKKFLNKEPIARIDGPAIVIEAIVQEAIRDTGIDMDWCYSCGRGFIFTDGDKEKARRELFLAMPNSDLTTSDL